MRFARFVCMVAAAGLANGCITPGPKQDDVQKGSLLMESAVNSHNGMMNVMANAAEKDAGLGAKDREEGIKEATRCVEKAEKADKLKSDQTKGVGIFVKKMKVPVFEKGRTFATDDGDKTIPKIIADCKKVLASFKSQKVEACQLAKVEFRHYRDVDVTTFYAVVGSRRGDEVSGPRDMVFKTENCSEMTKDEVPADFRGYMGKLKSFCAGGTLVAMPNVPGWKTGVDKSTRPHRPYRFGGVHCWKKGE